MVQSRFIYSSCSLIILILVCLWLQQYISGVSDTPLYSNAMADELYKAENISMDHFSLEQQLGNKTKVNRYHLPLVHGATWCGDINVWNDYAIFHNDVIQGRRSGNGYLKYFCRPSRCGGYGNRIQAITVGLIMAMLTNRVFLLEMTYPVNLLNYIAPNAVQWNATIVPRSIVTHDLYSPARIRKYWSSFANDLVTEGGAEMIEFRSNEGFSYFYPEILKSPEILQRFTSLGADNRTNYVGLYGCAVKYLFNLRPATTWAVTSQLTNLGLATGKYVSVHIRTSISSLDCGPRHATPAEWKGFLECAVNTSHFLAKKLRLESVPIYLASDEDVVKEYAITNFNTQVVLSQVYSLHVDRPRVKTAWLLHEGFLGMLTDMEVLSRAGMFIKSYSTFSDVIEGLGLFRRNESFMYNNCLHMSY